MQLAKVIGTVVSTRKEETLVGFKLLVLEGIDGPAGGAPGRVVAIDTLGAGIGDEVLYVTGGGARAAVPAGTPADAVVVGIVDTVDLKS